MPVIDLHTHLTPVRYRDAVAATGSWHGLGRETGELHWPGFCRSTAERISDMDNIGVDMQVVSPTDGFYLYDLDPAETRAVARECNDEVADLVTAHSDRFLGWATLPMQDISMAIEEMRRIMVDLHLCGVMIGDHVNGHTYDEPQFGPFWKAADELGAIVFFHQGVDNITTHRIDRYFLGNSVGNLAERTLTFGAMVYGGVIDRHPSLKLLLAHAGGYVSFATARMDKATNALASARGNPEGWHVLEKLPSDYLRAFYFDACTFTGPTLRFLVDMVGADHVVLGSDYPAPMVVDDIVRWIGGLDCLSAQEKTGILSKNPAALLGV